MNYEVIAIPIPASAQEAERLEQWLEGVANIGGELISVAPTQSSTRMLCIFRVRQPGSATRNAPPGSSRF